MATTSSFALDTGLPANVAAEKMILGAILLENHALSEAEEKLTPEDFSLDSHRRIYTHVCSLGNTHRPIDFVTLGEELARTEVLGQHASRPPTTVAGRAPEVNPAGVRGPVRTLKDADAIPPADPVQR